MKFPIVRTNKFGEHIVIEKDHENGKLVYSLHVNKYEFNYAGSFSECLRFGRLSYEEVRRG